MTGVANAALGQSASGNYGTGDMSADVMQAGNPLVQGRGLLSGLTTSKGLAGLQAAATGASMLSSIAAGNSQAAGLRLSASEDMVNAAGATAGGYAKSAGLRAQFLDTIGQRAAIAGASGVDGGQGIVNDTRVALTSRADTASQNILTSADMQNRANQISSLTKQLQANQAEEQGVMGALGGAAGLGLALLML